MYKIARVHKKKEKRLVRLALKSGLVDEEKFKGLYWAEFHCFGMTKRKRDGWRNFKYLTELYYDTTDYWGEGSEHSITSEIHDLVYWTDVVYNESTGKVIGPNTNLKLKGIIQYLKSLPRVYHKQIGFSHCKLSN